MFGHRYFGQRYFATNYFGPSIASPIAATTSLTFAPVADLTGGAMISASISFAFDTSAAPYVGLLASTTSLTFGILAALRGLESPFIFTDDGDGGDVYEATSSGAGTLYEETSDGETIIYEETSI